MKLGSVLLAVSIILSGCARDDKDKSGVHANGNCTQNYVDHYNSVSYLAQAALPYLQPGNTYSEYQKRDALQHVKNACVKLFNTYPSTSCRAEVNRKVTTISTYDHKDLCDRVSEYLATQPGAPSTPGPSAPIPQPERSERLGEIPVNKLKMNVLDAGKVKRLLEDPETVMVNGRLGRVTDFPDEIINGASICFLISSSSNSLISQRIHQGAEFKVVHKEETTHSGRRRLTVMLADTDLFMIGLGCTKTNGMNFQLHEVRDSVRGILDFTIEL